MSLVDPRNTEAAVEGFAPNVDNSIKTPKPNAVGKVLTYLSFILIIPGILYLSKRNELVKLQLRINEATSGIDVQLKKRRDTLTKLVDATKGSMEFEQSVLSDITRLRNQNVNPNNRSQVDGELSGLSSRILATFEAYPQLRSTDSVAKVIDSVEIIEQEIAAARRLYNSYVNSFNSSIFVWPASVVAGGMKLSTLPLYQASETDKKDVEVKFR